MGLLLAPVLFFFFKPRLGFAPAYFAALACFSFVTHDFMLYGAFPLMVIVASLAVAAVINAQGEGFFPRLLIWSGAFQAVLALLQWAGVYILFTPARPQDYFIPVGYMGHETVLGPFLVACMAPALWRKRWILAGLMGAAAALTFSSMTWGCLGVLGLIWLWHLRGPALPAALVALGGLALSGLYYLFPEHPLLSFNGRWAMWPYGWKAFQAAPWFGSGIGSWAGKHLVAFKAELVAAFQTTVPVHLHCDPLDFLVEYGALPGLPLVASLARFLRNFRPTSDHAICAVILVNCLANFPFCMPPLAIIFMVSWARSGRSGTLPF